MSVQELKALAHRYIDQADSEKVLEEVVRILNDSAALVGEPGIVYFSDEGRQQISEADAEIERGEFYTNEAAIDQLRSRGTH